MGHRLVAGAYGAHVAIDASDRALLDGIIARLPRGWTLERDTCETAEWCMRALCDGESIRLITGDGREVRCESLPRLQQAFAQELRRNVGYHTPDLLFVHAGVVAHGNKAIVLPGSSFAGKSTLVAALCRAGAEFYSDEYAILDRDGRVLQYREPLIMRGPGGRKEIDLAAEGTERPLPVALVVITSYRKVTAWKPRQISTAEAIIATLEHTIAARDRPGNALATLKLALQNATVLLGERGDADETAAALLETMDSLSVRNARPD